MRQEKIQLKSITLVISTVFLVLSAFFISAGLTGQVISDLEKQTANVIGAILFVMALIGYYVYFRMR